MTLVIADLCGTPQELIYSALNKIPSPRREEIFRLKGELERAQKVVGEALVRRFALEKFGVACPVILRGEKEKPYLKEVPDFCFNLSHSGEKVVLAVAELPVGVDVEKVVPREFSAVAARCFSIEEQKKIAASKAPLLEFYRVWTARESAVKRRGEGAAAMRGLRLADERVRSFSIEGERILPFAECAAPEYLLSVCTSEGESCALTVSFCLAEEVLRGLK